MKAVTDNCLPEEQDFDCLPEEYEGSLDPKNPKYQELRSRYIDEETSIKLLEPYHKIKKGEPPAIAAALFALMVDGLIVALGTAVKIRKRKEYRKITLNLEGKGSAFLAEFLKAIKHTSPTIDLGLLQQNIDKGEYPILLRGMAGITKWVKPSYNPEEWKITPGYASNQLQKWLIEERERHIKEEKKTEKFKLFKSSEARNVTFLLPLEDDGIN